MNSQNQQFYALKLKERSKRKTVSLTRVRRKLSESSIGQSSVASRFSITKARTRPLKRSILLPPSFFKPTRKSPDSLSVSSSIKPLSNRESHVSISINTKAQRVEEHVPTTTSRASLRKEPIKDIKKKLKKIQMFTERDDREHNISKDDPFTSIFIASKKATSEFPTMPRFKKPTYPQQKKKSSRRAVARHSFLVPEKQKPTVTSESDEEGETKEERIARGAWKTKEYWQLPENVRKAIDTANMNKKHSDFYYQLAVLNDKIRIFTQMFYYKVPQYQLNWFQRQKAHLEEKLQRQKAALESDIQTFDRRLSKLPIKASQFKSKQRNQRARRLAKQISVNYEGSPVSMRFKKNDSHSLLKVKKENNASSPKFRKRYNSVLAKQSDQQLIALKEMAMKFEALREDSDPSSPMSSSSKKPSVTSPASRKGGGQMTFTSIRNEAANFEKIHEVNEDVESEKHSPRKSQEEPQPSLSLSSSNRSKLNSLSKRDEFPFNVSYSANLKKLSQSSVNRALRSKPNSSKQVSSSGEGSRVKSKLSKLSLKEAINEINYGVAELRDIRMHISHVTEDVISQIENRSDSSTSKIKLSSSPVSHVNRGFGQLPKINEVGERTNDSHQQHQEKEFRMESPRERSNSATVAKRFSKQHGDLRQSNQFQATIFVDLKEEENEKSVSSSEAQIEDKPSTKPFSIQLMNSPQGSDGESPLVHNVSFVVSKEDDQPSIMRVDTNPDSEPIPRPRKLPPFKPQKIVMGTPAYSPDKAEKSRTQENKDKYTTYLKNLKKTEKKQLFNPQRIRGIQDELIEIPPTTRRKQKEDIYQAEIQKQLIQLQPSRILSVKAKRTNHSQNGQRKLAKASYQQDYTPNQLQAVSPLAEDSIVSSPQASTNLPFKNNQTFSINQSRTGTVHRPSLTFDPCELDQSLNQTITRDEMNINIVQQSASDSIDFASLNIPSAPFSPPRRKMKKKADILQDKYLKLKLEMGSFDQGKWTEEVSKIKSPVMYSADLKTELHRIKKKMRTSKNDVIVAQAISHLKKTPKIVRMALSQANSRQFRSVLQSSTTSESVSPRKTAPYKTLAQTEATPENEDAMVANPLDSFDSIDEPTQKYRTQLHSPSLGRSLQGSRPISDESIEVPIRQSLRMGDKAKIVFIDEDAEPTDHTLGPKISIKTKKKAIKPSALQKILSQQPRSKRERTPIQLPSVKKTTVCDSQSQQQKTSSFQMSRLLSPIDRLKYGRTAMQGSPPGTGRLDKFMSSQVIAEGRRVDISSRNSRNDRSSDLQMLSLEMEKIGEKIEQYKQRYLNSPLGCSLPMRKVGTALGSKRKTKLLQ